jgi:hypothetical protein
VRQRSSCRHPRDPLELEGGTTFHVVTNGIESALESITASSATSGHIAAVEMSFRRPHSRTGMKTVDAAQGGSR